MSNVIYNVFINDIIFDDVLLVTNKKLSEIDIKRVIPNVKTYEHYQDEYENDFYKINGKDIVSFSAGVVPKYVIVDTD